MFAVKVMDLLYRVFDFFQIGVVHRAGVDLVCFEVFYFRTDLRDPGDAGECNEPDQAKGTGYQQKT